MVGRCICSMHIDVLICGTIRSLVVNSRIARKVLGGSTLLMVDLCQGTQSHFYIKHGKRAPQGRFRRSRDNRSRARGKSTWKRGFLYFSIANIVRTKVRATQRAIKHVLRERWHAWEDARQIWLKEADERWQTEHEKAKLAAKAKKEAKRKARAEQRNAQAVPETQPEI